MPGIPAWGAVALAAGACVLGFAVDAMRAGEPGATFAVLYVLGCALAVVAVRRRGLFAAMVQPPLLMMIAVPVAYQTTGDDAGSSLKDLVLTVAVPLVDRFPLMFLTTMLVLGIGAARLLLDRPHPARSSASRPVSRPAESRRPETRKTESRKSETRTPEKTRARRPEKADPRPDATGRRTSGRAETRRARADAPASRRMRGTPRDDEQAHSAPETGRRPRVDGERRRDREPRRPAEPRRYSEPRPYSEPPPYPDAGGYPDARPYPDARAYPERRTGAENVTPHPTPRVRYRDRDQ